MNIITIICSILIMYPIIGFIVLIGYINYDKASVIHSSSVEETGRISLLIIFLWPIFLLCELPAAFGKLVFKLCKWIEK